MTPEKVTAILHGGILMTIVDSVACFAVLTGTPDEQALTTTDMNIRFLAPCLSDVTAKARVIACFIPASGSDTRLALAGSVAICDG